MTCLLSTVLKGNSGFKNGKSTTTTSQHPAANGSDRMVNDWHTWGLLWTDNEITFYLDGVAQFSSSAHAQAQNDFVPMIFSSSPAQVKFAQKGGETLPRFFIDFVRVYHSDLIGASIIR